MASSGTDAESHKEPISTLYAYQAQIGAGKNNRPLDEGVFLGPGIEPEKLIGLISKSTRCFLSSNFVL